LFSDISNATLDEVVDAINLQALYVKAYKHKVGSNYYLGIQGGGPHGTQFPNKIEIVGGTALVEVGFTLNQTNQNYGSGKVAYHRHHIVLEATISIDIISESENVRTELTDLVHNFFGYVMSDRNWSFYGRSIYDQEVVGETYQIIIKDNEISVSGESEMPRQGDTKDKLYINRINIPCTAILYSDRLATNIDGTTTIPQLSVNIISDATIPEPN
jgi:hypothetical protein